MNADQNPLNFHFFPSLIHLAAVKVITRMLCLKDVEREMKKVLFTKKINGLNLLLFDKVRRLPIPRAICSILLDVMVLIVREIILWLKFAPIHIYRLFSCKDFCWKLHGRLDYVQTYVNFLITNDIQPQELIVHDDKFVIYAPSDINLVLPFILENYDTLLKLVGLVSLSSSCENDYCSKLDSLYLCRMPNGKEVYVFSKVSSNADALAFLFSKMSRSMQLEVIKHNPINILRTLLIDPLWADSFIPAVRLFSRSIDQTDRRMLLVKLRHYMHNPNHSLFDLPCHPRCEYEAIFIEILKHCPCVDMAPYISDLLKAFLHTYNINNLYSLFNCCTCEEAMHKLVGLYGLDMNVDWNLVTSKFAHHWDYLLQLRKKSNKVHFDMKLMEYLEFIYYKNVINLDKFVHLIFNTENEARSFKICLLESHSIIYDLLTIGNLANYSNWTYLNIFLRFCLGGSKENLDHYKRNLGHRPAFVSLFVEKVINLFVKKTDIYVINDFLVFWCTDLVEGKKILAREFADPNGLQLFACLEADNLPRFLRWCFSNTEEMGRTLEEPLRSEMNDFGFSKDMLLEGKFALLDDILPIFFSSRAEIRAFKNHLMLNGNIELIWNAGIEIGYGVLSKEDFLSWFEPTSESAAAFIANQTWNDPQVFEILKKLTNL